MNQVKVQILKTTITAMYGTLLEGAQLRTSPEFAAHLVDECGAAKYADEDTVSAAIVADPVSVARTAANEPAVPAASQQDILPASGGEGAGDKPDSARGGEGGAGTESAQGAERGAEDGPAPAGGDSAADAAAKPDAPVQTSALAPKPAPRKPRASTK